jgi:hypothetical protein
MAFWIVYQGNTWKRARAGGYLWAPKLGKKQQAQEYWSNMARVQPGDLIFAGVDNALRAIAEVTQPAYTAERPDPRDDQYWYGGGWRLDVRYTDLPSPFFYADWLPAVAGEMPTKHSPFSSGGRPNQGYLFALPKLLQSRPRRRRRAPRAGGLGQHRRRSYTMPCWQLR